MGTESLPPSVKDVFADALDIHAGPQRDAYLAAACAGRPSVRGEVEQLLRCFEEAKTFLADEIDATVIEGESQRGATREGERTGTWVGRYKLIEPLGEGGFGAVFLAEQVEPIRRNVAVKIIRRGMDSSQVIARFEAERQALAMMDHPNIARVLDAGETVFGRPYFVMELVDGIPITEYCDQNSLAIEQRVRLFISVCRGTEHAHQKGVIHRDLKPSNVLVTLQDGQPVPKIIDFGIAKATTSERLGEHTLLTECHQLLGTPQYMSPEQAEMGATDIDTRSDVYSLGVLLYELLTGTTPFDPRALSKAAMGEIQKIFREVVPPPPSTKLNAIGERLTTIAAQRQVDPSALKKLLRGELDWIAGKSLEKDRDRRYATAGAMEADVERYLRREPIEAGPPSAVYVLRKFVARHRAILAAILAIVLVLILGLIGTSIGFVRARTQRNIAQNLARSEADQRRQAQEAGARAEQDRAAAQAVSDFLQHMLKSANPENARGKDVTVKQMLDQAAVKLDAGPIAQHPRTEAALRQTLGQTYESLGLFKPAAIQVRRAVELYRQFPDIQWELAESLMVLGNVLKEIPDYRGAENAYQEDLELCQRIVPNDHTMIAKCLSNLGMERMDYGDSRGAEALFQKAIRVSRMDGGEDRFEVSAALNNLGVLRTQANDYAGAVPFFRQALSIQRRLLGNDHPQIVPRLVDLAIALQQTGKSQEADALLDEAFQLAHQLYGPKHPVIASVLDAMEWERVDKGDYQGAASLLEEALEMSQELESQSDPAMLRRMKSLADIYRQLGQPQKSQQMFWRWMNARCDALSESIAVGNDNYNSRFERGSLFARMGRFPEALQDMLAASRFKPDAFRSYYFAALLSHELDKPDEYQACCQTMAGQLQTLPNPRLAACLATAALQAASPPFSTTVIANWIPTSGSYSSSHDVMAMQKLARALLLLRVSSWDAAASAFSDYRTIAPSEAMRSEADVCLALIHLRQSRGSATESALTQAISATESKLSQAAKADLGESFDEWLLWKNSDREARATLAQTAGRQQ